MRTTKHKTPYMLWITGMLGTGDKTAAQGLTYGSNTHSDVNWCI